MEEIRLVNRAKWLLIDAASDMTESEAHRYIEKQAMDRCVTRRSIAENIICTCKQLAEEKYDQIHIRDRRRCVSGLGKGHYGGIASGGLLKVREDSRLPRRSSTRISTLTPAR